MYASYINNDSNGNILEFFALEKIKGVTSMVKTFKKGKYSLLSKCLQNLICNRLNLVLSKMTVVLRLLNKIKKH